MIVLRSSAPGGQGDVRRASLRSRDSWLAAGGPDRVVLPDDPAAAGAAFELVVREPEAMVPSVPLEGLALSLRPGEALAPEGFFRGGSAPGQGYVTFWEFEAEAGRRRAARAPGDPFAPGTVPPVELRRAGETGAPRPVPGWVVHSFAGRRSWDRPELLPLVPASARRVLEVGCGEGAFAARLQEGGASVTAVEPDRLAAATARGRVGRLLESTLEEALDALSGERFDLVVLADVLEHLADPVASLVALRPLLAPRGAVLLSLPNASHAAVLAGILQGRWDHTLEGIVSDDHRTYAGRAGWTRLLAAAGLAVEGWGATPVSPPALAPWLRVLSGTGLPAADLEAGQWFGLARPGPVPDGPDSVPLAPILPTGRGDLDADDPVASVRALLRAEATRRGEVSLRAPNAVAPSHVLPLFSGELVAGSGRTALARGTTAAGLGRRFRGSGIGLRVDGGGAEEPRGLLGRLSDEALRAGLPAAPDAPSAPDLRLQFRREDA